MEAAIKDAHAKLAVMDGRQQPLEASLHQLSQRLEALEANGGGGKPASETDRQELATHRQDLARLKGELSSGIEMARGEHRQELATHRQELAGAMEHLASGMDTARGESKAKLDELAQRLDAVEVREGPTTHGIYIYICILKYTYMFIYVLYIDIHIHIYTYLYIYIPSTLSPKPKSRRSRRVGRAARFPRRLCWRATSRTDKSWSRTGKSWRAWRASLRQG